MMKFAKASVSAACCALFLSLATPSMGSVVFSIYIFHYSPQTGTGYFVDTVGDVTVTTEPHAAIIGVSDGQYWEIFAGFDERGDPVLHESFDPMIATSSQQQQAESAILRWKEDAADSDPPDPDPVDPGSSNGIQTFAGDLAYASDAVFSWEIDYALDATGLGTRGTQFSGVNVGGNLSIADGAEFRVVTNQPIDFDGGEGLGFWGQNHVWSNIFDVTGSISGSFGEDAWVNVYDSNGTLQDTSSVGAFTIDGTTLSYTAIPEPNTLALTLLVGITALLLERGRRRQK